MTPIFVLGLVAAAYVLIHERAPVPFRDTYEINVEVTEAHGVVPGLGQPVNVAGVNVGSISDARLTADGNALITLRINRSEIPRVYANATAALSLITPLSDMRLDLDPGRPPSRALPPGATIDVARSSVPVSSSDLLSSLDSDTRDFITSLLASLDQGTQGRGPDLRRLLRALGPTTDQVHQITAALARRRGALARLVHNLAAVTRAASRDRELASVVRAGNQTLEAVAAQDRPLRQALDLLPGTLARTHSTLGHLKPFAGKLGPTLTAVRPATKRLAGTLRSVGRFSETGTSTLSRRLRPLVRRAQPLVRDLGSASADLNELAPNMTSVFQVLNYAVNELAYNPPDKVNGYPDEGYLFWLAHFVHAFGSTFSIADAHGSLARAMVTVDCTSFVNAAGFAAVGSLLKLAMGVTTPCPKSDR